MNWKKRMFNKVGMKATPLDIRRDRWKHVSGETRDFKVKYNDELLERKKSCAKKWTAHDGPIEYF